MNPHDEIRALLTLAAARALDGAEQAKVEGSVNAFVCRMTSGIANGTT